MYFSKIGKVHVERYFLDVQLIKAIIVINHSLVALAFLKTI